MKALAISLKTIFLAANIPPAFTLVLFLAGCQSSVDDPSAGSSLDGHDNTSLNSSTDGDIEDCPDESSVREELSRATFAILVEYETGPRPTDRLPAFIGTGFRIESNLLATNAHVADAILNPVLPVTNVYAVQAGTGRVDTCRSAAIHPDWNGNPVDSPDVAIIETLEDFDDVVDIAELPDETRMTLGDRLVLAGFPSDVIGLFPIVPGESVPQATTLSGEVSALRNFNDNSVVTDQTIDIIQHSLSTSPGTSGSALALCGRVVAINNAGTVQTVLTIGDDGALKITRVPVAANGFGIHVKHLSELLRHGDTAIVRLLPPPPPNYNGLYTCEAKINSLLHHEFQLVVGITGGITGTSCFDIGGFRLQGSVDRFGLVTISDDAEEYGYLEGAYDGFADPGNQTLLGTYYEDGLVVATWQCLLEDSAPPPCISGNVEPVSTIDGEWALSYMENGETVGFCLTISQDEVIEFQDGCNGAGTSVSPNTVFADDGEIEVEFFISHGGTITWFNISGTRLSSDLYNVTVTSDRQIYHVVRGDVRMERLSP